MDATRLDATHSHKKRIEGLASSGSETMPAVLTPMSSSPPAVLTAYRKHPEQAMRIPLVSALMWKQVLLFHCEDETSPGAWSASMLSPASPQC
jgi:hypothetical protein